MRVYGTAFTDEEAEILRRYGLGFEIAQYATPAGLDSFNAVNHDVSRYMRGINGVSLHGAYFDTNYTTSDPLMLAVVEKRFMQSIEAAVFHGVDRVVFHSTYRRFDGRKRQTLDAWIEHSISFWRRFEANIPDGMAIYIENAEDDDPVPFIDMIRAVNSPKVRCCFDAGHARVYSHVPLNTWVNALGGDIAHVHIHDNNGVYDDHLTPGEGNMPLADVINRILEYAGKDTPFVLECGDKPACVKWLEANGFLQR